MTPALVYTARSHLGMVRENNEDSAYAGPRLLALADGMGGHAAGEIASQFVVASLARLDEDEPGQDLTGALTRALTVGNEAIAAHVEAHVDLDPMNPFERKVCHDVVADAGLISESEGVEPQRYVVIFPADDESEGDPEIEVTDTDDSDESNQDDE